MYKTKHPASKNDGVLTITPCMYGVISTHGGAQFDVVYRHPDGQWSYADDRYDYPTKAAANKRAKKLNDDLEDYRALDANECSICHQTSCGGPYEHR